MAAAIAAVGCSRTPSRPDLRTFKTPEEAVAALTSAVAKDDMPAVLTLFGEQGKALIDPDAAAARRNRQVFTVAAAEGWRLVDDERGKTLVIGNEGWPFPVPLVQDESGWHFDAAAGQEEVTARRIGRNELAAIRASYAYVKAQRLYAEQGHDGKAAGLYAMTFRSDPGKQNGLYWPSKPGEKRSPLGDLITEAADHSNAAGTKPRAPFHGYYFRILSGQGAAAPGGARNYVDRGAMSKGFALVAWPAEYDTTGVMTFIVNQDGVVREKDLGPDTDDLAQRVTLYDPDPSWTVVE